MTAQPFPFEASAVSAGIPETMKHAIMRSLSKDRDHRQGTVRQFYEEVAGAASSAGPSPALVGVGAHRGGDTSAMPAAGPAPKPPVTPDTRRLPASCLNKWRTLRPPAVKPSPRRRSPRPERNRERGGGKGLIIGLGAAAGVLAIVGVVIAARQLRPKDDPPIATTAPATTAPATATAAPDRDRARKADRAARAYCCDQDR